MKITEISCEDWQAFYFDGKKVCEDHIINAYDIILKIKEYSKTNLITYIDFETIELEDNEMTDKLIPLDDNLEELKKKL